MPELCDLREDMGQTWARAELIQNDLLGIYQGMLRNYHAQQSGLREHADNGDPVIAVKATEIVAVGDKIIKIDQDRVNSRVNAAKLLQVAEPAKLPGSSPLPSPALMMAGLSEDIDDADFEEAE